MQKLRIRQRWMSLPWGIITLAIFLVLLVAGIIGNIQYPDETPSIRLVIPAFALYGYVVFALLFNWRTTVVTPKGLSVGVWPLMVQPPRKLARNEIRHCFFRNVSTYDEGTLLESYYAAGVESMDGRQIEFSAPHETVEQAVQAANQIAEMLNRQLGQNRIEVYEVDQIPETAEILSTLLLITFWLALFIAAIFLGDEWIRMYPEIQGRLDPGLQDEVWIGLVSIRS